MSSKVIAVCIVVIVAAGACGGDRPSNAWVSRPQATRASASASPSVPTPSGGATGGGAGSKVLPSTIPQPDVGDLPVRPDAERVDLEMPMFSDPTNVTNPLFPVSSQASVVLVGTVDDQPFRTEVTLLPNTRIIEWAGQRVEVLVSQYVAFLDGRIHEVAYDYYAQADDGSVWYFGEDVFNFADGAIVDTHGTWIAGEDGPAAMIMPASPEVGDVYRPENIPGLVFEEVTVKAVGEQLDGPFDPIRGGLRIEELHMDGTREDKTFAPGYGEFFTSGGGDVEALAIAVPTDAASEPMPAGLETMVISAQQAFEAAANEDWTAVTSATSEARDAADSLGPSEVPRLLTPILGDALEALQEAGAARAVADTRNAAIDVMRSALDLQLRYRPAVEVDLDRFGLWLQQLDVDAQAEDIDDIRTDFFAIDYVRDRIASALAAGDLATVNADLEALLNAIGDEDFDAIATGADELGSHLDAMTPLGR